ncbi:MAG TPA: protein translocase subunit SecD [Thermoanaerobaculia bacterium]|nr:protein translocase subunit SecD [Thermoanaerobaculia bacterium]
MKRNLLWRGLVIAGSVIAAAAAAWPPKEKINLGLDLQGGMHLVLQVHTEDALRLETEADMERLVQQAREDKTERVPPLKPRRIGDSRFVISGLSAEDKGALGRLADKYLQGYNRKEQGDSVIFEMRPDQVAKIRQYAVTQAKQTIDNRVNQYGVTEPVIQEASGQRIVVQLPGVDDFERVRNLIKNTAFLEFRITRFPQKEPGAASREEILQHFGGRLPDDLEILSGDEKNDREGNTTTGTRYFAVEKRRTVTGRDLSTARPGQGQFNQPIINFNLKPDAADLFGKLTGDNVGSGLAIVLDGRIVSAPVINNKITDRGMIEGSFTQKSAEDLATVLRSGALPASITYLEERTVGPSLGRDSIRQGLRAGIVGTSLVVIAMLLVYNLSGVNAITALILNVLILFGGMGLFHSTLTLPGIAGVILTIGMAVDANVLVFERIREELRAGRTVRSAIDFGFDRAFTSIIDTHVTTMTSAMFLFQFGTGPIKGFAVTLFIGLLASLYTAVFVSRWIFDLVLSRRRVQALSI